MGNFRDKFISLLSHVERHTHLLSNKFLIMTIKFVILALVVVAQWYISCPIDVRLWVQNIRLYFVKQVWQVKICPRKKSDKLKDFWFKMVKYVLLATSVDLTHAVWAAVQPESVVLNQELVRHGKDQSLDGKVWTC